MKKIWKILVVIVFAGASLSSGQSWMPTTLELSAPETVFWDFEGNLTIPVTVSGTPSKTVFCVFTKDQSGSILNIQNGYLGWHYVNKVDTCIYYTKGQNMQIGANTITWTGNDMDGNKVASGDYYYYLFGYDNVNFKQQVASIISIGCGRYDNFITEDYQGNPLAHPILYTDPFGGTTGPWPSIPTLKDRDGVSEEGEQINRMKFIIGSDPHNVSGIEKTRYPVYFEHAQLEPSPYDPDMFYTVTNEPSQYLGHMRRYTWVPNGESILDTSWGEEGEVTWSILTNGSWWVRMAAAFSYIGNDKFIGCNSDYSGLSWQSELPIVDAIGGYIVDTINLADWWIRPDDGVERDGEKGQQSSGPNHAEFRVVHGEPMLALTAHTTCLQNIINPQDAEQDWQRWINGNGDYIADHNWQSDDPNAWVCHDYLVPGFTYTASIDAEGFVVSSSWEEGAVSFNLFGPDGTGIDVMAFAGETAGPKYTNFIVQYDSAYDGIYCDNESSSPESREWQENVGGVWYVAHDSMRGNITVIPDSIAIISPNGMETYIAGSSTDISWSFYNVNSVNIEFSSNGGASWTSIIQNAPSTGLYTWEVPNNISQNCLIKITDSTNALKYDISSMSFSIVKPTLVYSYPNGGESIVAGSIVSLSWSSTSERSISLEYSINNGISWTSIATNIQSDGSYDWLVPNVTSQSCLIKITDSVFPDVFDISNSTFTITLPSVTFLYPNGGEKIASGSIVTLLWESVSENSVNLEYSTNNGISWTLIVQNIQARGSYNWLVPNIISQSCLIRVSDSVFPDVFDISNSAFSINQPSLSLEYPIGGEMLAVADSAPIQWTSSFDGNVKIQYSTDAGVTWSAIVESTPSTGSYNWVVPNNKTSNYLIKISDAANPSIYDISDSTFSVTQSSIIVIYPNGDEYLKVGSNTVITWRGTRDKMQSNTNVKIEYTSDEGATWKIIHSNTPSTGSYDWIVPYDISDHCWIKITDKSNTNIYDTTDAAFSIMQVEVIVISPNGGEKLVSGTQQTISWECVNVDSICVEYSTNNGDSWLLIADIINTEAQSILWTVPETYSTDCLIRLSNISLGVIDQSDAQFSIESETSVEESPSAFWLLGDAYPNPFNPLTTIEFSLAEESRVELKVHNLAGQEVATLKNEQMSPGIHSVVWNAAGLPTGLYFYSLKTAEFSDIKKMMLMK